MATSLPTAEPVRGAGAFDGEGLRRRLHALGDGQQAAFELLADYRAFYGLTQFSTPNRTTAICLHVQIEAGTRVVVQEFVPEAVHAFAILTPGWTDHVGLYGYVIDYMLSRGIAVIAYDQLGHGLSDGDPGSIKSFDSYVGALRRVHEWAVARHGFEWCHWFGQSMGGAITLEYLQQAPPQQCGEVVLFAPLVRPYAWWFNRWVFALAKLTIDARARVIAPSTDNPEFLQLQLRDPLQPQLLTVVWVQAMVDWYRRFEAYPVSVIAPKIIQGYADRTVSWRHAVTSLGRRYPGAQWHMMPKAQHHLVNETQPLRNSMWRWLNSRCEWRRPDEPSPPASAE